MDAAEPARDPATATDPEATDPAAAPTPVFVSEFQARNADARGLAGLIEAVVARRLAGEPGLKVIGVDDAPAYDNASARLYMDACPPDEVVGCTFVTASRAKARFAVTGSVLSLPDGARVEVAILDVDGSRVMVSFKSELDAGHDEAFAEGVAKVLVAAVHGDIGAEDDIRDGDEAPRRPSNAEFRAQLADLSKELGNLTDVQDRPDAPIRPPTLTARDLDAFRNAEGKTPWERLGMSEGAYLRYRNSGMSLDEWRERSYGRQFQLHARAFGGWWNGPLDHEYFNLYAYDAGLNVEDSYTAEYVRNGNGLIGGLEAAFGLLPFLDVGVAAGTSPGGFTVQIESSSRDEDPIVLPQNTLWVGPRATIMLFPNARVHPGFGGGFTAMNMPAVDAVVGNLEAQSHVFPSSWLFYAQAFAAAEVRMGEHVDLFARVPVDIHVGGKTLREYRETTNAALVPTTPNAGGDVGVGVIVGIQAHWFGRKPARSAAFEDMGDEPEE